MDLELFSKAGLSLLFRWIHLLAGITWIGLLYYFNLVQVPFLAEADAATKTGAITKLVPRALWWFRWGAMFTFLSGLVLFGLQAHLYGGRSWAIIIGIGSLLGTLMFLNVWLVIWPNQKVVIASTLATAGGGQADPRAAAAGARAFIASRSNLVFSVPMLFCMAAAWHLQGMVGATGGAVQLALVLLLIAAVEANVLLGKKGVGPSKILDKHVGAIHVGVAFTLIIYVLLETI